MNLVLLHGFWGAPSDWDQFIAKLTPERVWCPPLFESGDFDSTHDFATWTENLCDAIQIRFQKKVRLAGYSLGGRLAVHAAIARPELFEKVMLLSTNPGLLDKEALNERERWTELWIERFEKATWEELSQAWNDQSVFFGSARSPKQTGNRELLLGALKNWSMGQHTFNLQDLQNLPLATDWLFGASDQKFLAVKAQLERQNVEGSFKVIEGAGHRILKDQPEAAARLWLRKA